MTTLHWKPHALQTILVDRTDQRDQARDIAVRLEQEIAAVDDLHWPHRTCKQHGITECDCGSGFNYRCYQCVGREFSRPCATWRATHRADWPE